MTGLDFPAFLGNRLARLKVFRQGLPKSDTPKSDFHELQGLTVSQKRYTMEERRLQNMSQTSMVHVRVDTAMKDQAVQALGSMGMTVSDAVRILLKRVVTDQAFPLELKVPNAETQAAMEEAREIMASRSLRFSTSEALFDDLEKKAKQ